MSADLTPRQSQILELIRNHIRDTGFPPTRAEIAAAFGFRSANAAEDHLRALARRGAIELTPGSSRAIRLVTDGPGDETLPVVGRVAAGSPILAQEHVDTSFLMEVSMWARRPDYLLKVRGMSMRDAGILDGDLLAVQKAKDAKNGQIVVARLGDEVTVKRLRRTSKGIELIPENPDFETIHVPPDTADFELEGIAVGLIRNTMLM